MSIWDDERVDTIALFEADVRAAGLGHVWDSVLRDVEGAATNLMLGTIGTLARYMHESGLVLTPST